MPTCTAKAKRPFQRQPDRNRRIQALTTSPADIGTAGNNNHKR